MTIMKYLHKAVVNPMTSEEHESNGFQKGSGDYAKQIICIFSLALVDLIEIHNIMTMFFTKDVKMTSLIN